MRLTHRAAPALSLAGAAVGGGRPGTPVSRRRWWIGLLLCPIAATPAPAPAQERPDTGLIACTTPAPLPRCKSFVVFEFGVEGVLWPHRTASDTVPADAPTFVIRYESPLTYLTWEIGGMANRTPSRALGASAFLSVPPADVEELRVGVRGRYRRWRADWIQVDLDPTLTFQRSQLVDTRDATWTLAVGLQGVVSRSTLLRISGQAEVGPDGPGVQVGARAGSRYAVLAGIGLPLLWLAGLIFLPQG